MHRILFASILVCVALQTCFHEISADNGKSAKGKGSGSKGKGKGSGSNENCINESDCPGVECYKWMCKNSSSSSSSSDDKKCVAEALVAGNCSEHQMYCLDQITCATACDNITECPGGEDERNCTQQCGCEDIYEFILPCKKYTDKWITIKDHLLGGFTIGPQVLFSTPESCQALCLATPGCRSCEIDKSYYDECWLNTITAQEALLVVSGIDETVTYDLYLRECEVC